MTIDSKRTYRPYTYIEKALKQTNPTAKEFLELVDRKKSNLCISLDVTKKEEFLRLADVLGPYVCLVKTHIDIIDDFDYSLIHDLQALALKHDFMLFEDRKFADIGNTVKHQYANGVYRIAQWADFTNCHIVPGEGIIAGLKEIGLNESIVPKPRALLLLAQMSSVGSLATGEYTQKNVDLAAQHRDFVAGFIASGNLDRSDFTPIVMTPGVALAASGDGLGQQYRTPHLILEENLSDIIIVGRNILQAADPAVTAAEYQKVGWSAYLSSLAPKS